jgi:hypothetical protein
VELIRQFPEQKKGFVLFGLWGFPRFWGLDRFWGVVGEEATARAEEQATATAISGRFGFAFTPAFGRVVFRFAGGFYGTAEAVPLSETGFVSL